MSEGSKGKSERLGDDTRARIDDLKGGWSLDTKPSADPKAVISADLPPDLGSLPKLPSPRIKSKTVPPPPPPPGSKRSKSSPPGAVRKKASPSVPPSSVPPSSVPPSSVPPFTRRAKSVSAPPPIPKKKEVVSSGAKPVKKLDGTANAAALSKTAPNPTPNVVVASELRDDDPTLHKTDPEKEDDLAIPAAVKGAEVDEEAPTRVSSSFTRQQAAAPEAEPEPTPEPKRRASSMPAPVVSNRRLPDTIARSSGALGDIAYLFRVMKTRSVATKEIQSLAQRITAAKEVRHGKLVEMAKLAVGDDAFDQTMVGRARTSLLKIEDKRSQHAGRVAAVDEKLGVLDRSREERAKGRVSKLSELNLQLEAVAASMEPLKATAAAARKRAAVLKRHLSSLDTEIREKESSTVAVVGAADKASVNAEIASLRAERAAVASDEPAILADIDHVDPQIATLREERSKLMEAVADLEQDRVSDIERVDEKIAALRAGRIVEDRLVSDQVAEKAARLLELGEEMHEKPPEEAVLHTKGIVRQDLEIAALETRRIELKDLLAAAEKPAMIRGGVWLAAIVMTTIAVAALLMTL